MTRKEQITEKTILKEGFVKVQKNLYLKKVGLRRKYWCRCESCGRFAETPIDVKASATKLITTCSWCFDPEQSEYPPRTFWDLTLVSIKIHEPEFRGDSKLIK